jgi:hypothetical protein
MSGTAPASYQFPQDTPRERVPIFLDAAGSKGGFADNR